MATVRVGVLNDTADLASAPGDMADWLEREVERLRDAGRIADPVEFVHAYGLGLPTGTAEAIEQAYQDLVDQDVSLIVGPAISDNAVIVAPLAERLRVPTLYWAGVQRARGRYTFQLQVGSVEEEALVIARYLATRGARRLGVIHDLSPLGTAHFKALEDEAARRGLELVAATGLAPLGMEADEAVRQVLAATPEALVYLGGGQCAVGIAKALAACPWTGLRIMTSAGDPALATACDGWTHVAMHSDTNRVLQALLADHAIPADQAATAARGHDLGRLVAEAIAHARDSSRESIRLGLEHVRWLPAAQGADGTLLGFGHQDRGALHGRYLVLRQWRDGQSVDVSAG